MLDQKDKDILNLVQGDFPITSRPFLTVAEEVGLTEDEVIQRLAAMKDKGLIRRIGGIFDSKKLGYHSTLCAIRVPEDRLQEVADLINSYINVTHNYIREHSYNMWFTLIAPSEEAVEQILTEIRNKTGIDDVINLPAVNFFKIRVNFNMNEV